MTIFSAKKLFSNLILALLLAIPGSTFAQSAPTKFSEDYWREYIDYSIGRPNYYLYTMAKNTHALQSKTPLRALVLGSGSGDPDVDLVSQGWDVTSVDSSPRSGEVITERVKYLPGHHQFILGDFGKVNISGEYDFVMSFFSLPWGSRNDFPQLLNNISHHMKQGGFIAVNFFGPEHTFVKDGSCFGMDEAAIRAYFTANHLVIRQLIHRNYHQPDAGGTPTYWDLYDVLAEKQG